MADIYLSSVDGNDADDGSTWALAKATISAAMTAAGAGGRVFIDSAHVEDANIGSPGTAANPVQLLSIDRTGNPEPPTALLQGADFRSSSSTRSYSGFAFAHGIKIGGASGFATQFISASPWAWLMENCVITQPGSAANTIDLGATFNGDDQLLHLKNCEIQFNNTGAHIRLKALRFIMEGGSITGGAVPTTLFRPTGNDGSPIQLLVRGVDLSAFGSGKNLVIVSSANPGKIQFAHCKLGASVSLTTGSPPGQGGAEAEFVNCDSADTNYRYYKLNYQGEVFHETTIVRTGGGSDGITSLSRKLVSSANSKLYFPLFATLPAIWNETVGSAITVTVEGVTDNVTLTDKEAWLEVEYLGTSGFPRSLLASDRAAANAAHLGSGANQASSTETWTTTGMTTPVRQKFEVTFTPQEKGWIYPRVMLAKPSTTLYADFKATAG